MNRDTADPPVDEQEKQLKGESWILMDPLQVLEPEADSTFRYEREAGGQPSLVRGGSSPELPDSRCVR